MQPPQVCPEAHLLGDSRLSRWLVTLSITFIQEVLQSTYSVLGTALGVEEMKVHMSRHCPHSQGTYYLSESHTRVRDLCNKEICQSTAGPLDTSRLWAWVFCYVLFHKNRPVISEDLHRKENPFLFAIKVRVVLRTTVSIIIASSSEINRGRQKWAKPPGCSLSNLWLQKPQNRPFR